MKVLTDAVFETGLLVTRVVRAHARRTQPAGLTLSEFRGLACVGAYPGCSLTDMAEYLGLRLPTASKLADGLIARRLMTRRADAADRRRQHLALTAAGQARLDTAMAAVRKHLDERLAGLSAADQKAVLRAMRLLQPLLTPALG